MAKVPRLRGEAHKYIAKQIDGLSNRYSKWEVWQDFIIMSAVSIANVFHGPYWDEREKMYMDRVSKYSSKEAAVFAELLSEVVLDMERDSEQDFLGELFMGLELGNKWKGQFFTPYTICRAMSAMTYGEDLAVKIERQGWVSVNDPACGAGATLIAFANECRRPGKDVNYQTSVLFVAQDIDFLAGCMCYIQLSLMGCPGYVVIDNTLTNPSLSYDKRGLIPVDGPNVWYTPMYYSTIWQLRRTWALMDMQFQTAGEILPEETPPPAPKQDVKYSIKKNGQLSLF